MHSDFSLSAYFKDVHKNTDQDIDLSYLFDISDADFRNFFSINSFAIVEQRNLQDYEKHYRYIYSGCSETYGDFLSSPNEGEASSFEFDYEEVKSLIWGTIVGRFLGIEDNLNLAVGGASAYGIVTKILRQIRVYGPPEHVLVLFPNIDSRITLVKDEDRLVSGGRDNSEFINDISTIGSHEAAYSKRPHKAEEVLSRRWVTYLNLQSIIALEQICKAHGINLIYSTWDSSTNEILLKANELAASTGTPIPFANYITFEYRKSPQTCKIAAKIFDKDCHLNEFNNPQWYIGRGDSHMGVHAHIHAAELFTEELKRRDVL